MAWRGREEVCDGVAAAAAAPREGRVSKLFDSWPGLKIKS